MKSYIADANIFLRYILQDNIKQAKISEQYFEKAKKRGIHIRILSETIPELEYVFRKVYKEERRDIGDYLFGIIRTTYFEVERRKYWEMSIKLYKESSADLIDCLLSVIAKTSGADVLSFDKDFKKLKKYEK